VIVNYELGRGESVSVMGAKLIDFDSAAIGSAINPPQMDVRLPYNYKPAELAIQNRAVEFGLLTEGQSIRAFPVDVFAVGLLLLHTFTRYPQSLCCTHVSRVIQRQRWITRRRARS
jgi:hypothetical protein